MDAQTLRQHAGAIVELRLSDEARVQAEILQVNPEARTNHMVFKVLAVRAEGSSYDPPLRVGQSYACPAQDVVDVASP